MGADQNDPLLSTQYSLTYELLLVNFVCKSSSGMRIAVGYRIGGLRLWGWFELAGLLSQKN